jgi:Transposase DDE domain group 1
MNSTATNRVRVESGGQGVVAHVGLHALGSLADSLVLGSALSSCIEPAREQAPQHDRGKVLVQMALVLAGGGESCADVEHLRAQSDLFGAVPSDTS